VFEQDPDVKPAEAYMKLGKPLKQLVSQAQVKSKLNTSKSLWAAFLQSQHPEIAFTAHYETRIKRAQKAAADTKQNHKAKSISAHQQKVRENADKSFDRLKSRLEYLGEETLRDGLADFKSSEETDDDGDDFSEPQRAPILPRRGRSRTASHPTATTTTTTTTHKEAESGSSAEEYDPENDRRRAPVVGAAGAANIIAGGGNAEAEPIKVLEATNLRGATLLNINDPNNLDIQVIAPFHLPSADYSHAAFVWRLDAKSELKYLVLSNEKKVSITITHPPPTKVEAAALGLTDTDLVAKSNSFALLLPNNLIDFQTSPRKLETTSFKGVEFKLVRDRRDPAPAPTEFEG